MVLESGNDTNVQRAVGRASKKLPTRALPLWLGVGAFTCALACAILVTMMVVRRKRALRTATTLARWPEGVRCLLHGYSMVSPIPFTADDSRRLRDAYARRPEVCTPAIFVAISSYRDPELCLTLLDMYDKAHNPRRVFCGLTVQNDSGDGKTCDPRNVLEFLPDSHVRLIEMPYREAKGPTFARAICETLFRGEPYFMMVDSHMRFEPGWDSDLVHMVLSSPHPEKTIITQYPEGYDRVTARGITSYAIQKRRGFRTQGSKGFNADGIPEFESYSTNTRAPSIPPLVPFWGACQHFSRSAILADVPYSEFTENLFFGEEILYGMRAFTHGYDLRGPTHSVLYHNWKREHRKTFWEIDDHARRVRSVEFVKRVLRGDVFGRYGLGTARSAQDFYEYIGMDLRAGVMLRPKGEWTLPERFRET